jgi:hypothetical protein
MSILFCLPIYPIIFPLAPPCLFIWALKLNVLKCSRSLDGSKLVSLQACLSFLVQTQLFLFYFLLFVYFDFEQKTETRRRRKIRNVLTQTRSIGKEDEDEKIEMLMMMSAENGIECFLRFSFVPVTLLNCNVFKYLISVQPDGYRGLFSSFVSRFSGSNSRKSLTTSSTTPCCLSFVYLLCFF